MVKVEIYINRRGDKNLPEKITTEADSNFFKEGEVIQFPKETIKLGNFTGIKIITVTKQIIIGLAVSRSAIVIHAERCF